MEKILEMLASVIFWIPNLYSGLERNQHANQVTDQWKSYQQSMLTSEIILIGYCVVVFVWGPWFSDASGTGNYSAITASVNGVVGIF